VDPITFGPRRSNLNAELGKFYTANGPEAQMLVQNILAQSKLKGKKASALAELLTRSLIFGGTGAAQSIASQ
jgi:2-keto-3-deoxy-L-rhamnonate aldolase RhmA